MVLRYIQKSSYEENRYVIIQINILTYKYIRVCKYQLCLWCLLVFDILTSLLINFSLTDEKNQCRQRRSGRRRGCFANFRWIQRIILFMYCQKKHKSINLVIIYLRRTERIQDPRKLHVVIYICMYIHMDIHDCVNVWLSQMLGISCLSSNFI